VDDPVVQRLLEGDPAIRCQVLHDLLNALHDEVAGERGGARGLEVRGCWR
jgi:hypothetical protein